MIKIHYLDTGAFLYPPNGVGSRVWFCLQFQLVHQRARDDVLVTAVVDDEIAHLALDRARRVEDLMSLYGVGGLLVA